MKKKEKERLVTWKNQVTKQWGAQCVVCQYLGEKCDPGKLQFHHIISRRCKLLRYCPDNGVSLCAKHHALHPVHSIHRNPLFVLALLIDQRGWKWAISLLSSAQIDGALEKIRCRRS